MVLTKKYVYIIYLDSGVAIVAGFHVQPYNSPRSQGQLLPVALLILRLVPAVLPTALECMKLIGNAFRVSGELGCVIPPIPSGELNTRPGPRPACACSTRRRREFKTRAGQQIVPYSERPSTAALSDADHSHPEEFCGALGGGLVLPVPTAGEPVA